MRLNLMALSACLALGSGGAWAADPIGTWLTEAGDATVEIADCGGALCGKIIALEQPNDPKTGAPLTDKENPEEAKRGLPLVGVQILRSMKVTDQPDKWSGEVYNPEDGRTYRANLMMKSADILRLEGCMLIICSGETWTRVASASHGAGAPARPVSGSKKAPAAQKPAAR